MALLGLYESKKERAARLAEEEKQRLLEELQERQSQLGNTLVERLSRAAAENNVYNVLSSGDVHVSLGPIRVQSSSNDGSNFSVRVGLRSPQPPTERGYSPEEIAYIVCEANIDLMRRQRGQELCASGRSFDGKEYRRVEDFEEFAQLLEKRVREHRCYNTLEE